MRETIGQHPLVRERVDAFHTRVQDSKAHMEAWLLQMEAELWEVIREAQEQAQRHQVRSDRARNAQRYYQTLGLEPGADLKAIKAAWRSQMQRNHPDKYAHNPEAEKAAHHRAQEINQAYAELTALLTGRENRRSE